MLEDAQFCRYMQRSENIMPVQDAVESQVQPRQTGLKQKPIRPGYEYVYDTAPQLRKQAPHKTMKRRTHSEPLPSLLAPPPRSAEAILEEIRAAPGKTQRRLTPPASSSAPLPVVKPQAAPQASPPPLLTPPIRPTAAVVEEIQLVSCSTHSSVRGVSAHSVLKL